MKRFILIGTLFLVNQVVSAQMVFSVNSGFGTYRMSDMKAYQLAVRNFFPVNAQITSSFPSFWVYDVSADFLFEDYSSFGLSVSRGSTGGRIDYTDYSGSMGNIQLLSYFSVGGNFGMVLPLSGKRVKMQLLLKPTFVSTNVRLRDYLVLGGVEQTSATSYRSSGLYAQPTAVATARFGRIGINAFAGYNFTLKVDVLKFDNSQRTILTTNGKDLRADWSGVRLGGGVSFFFKEKLQRKGNKYDHISMGLGVGLDYGGLGGSILMYPNRSLGAFVGLGLIPTGLGLNGGLKLRYIRDGKKVIPHLLAMYGYNTVMMVVNARQLNKVFYGTTIGAGLDIKLKPEDTNYWSVGIAVPIRGPEVDAYLHDLNNTYGVTMARSLLPATLSVGYRFSLHL